MNLSITTLETLASSGIFDCWANDVNRNGLLWARLWGVPQGVRPKLTNPFCRVEMGMQTKELTLEIHPAELTRARHAETPDRADEIEKAGWMLKFWDLVGAGKVVFTVKCEPLGPG